MSLDIVWHWFCFADMSKHNSPSVAASVGPNAISSGFLSADQRLSEIAEILAAGLMRLQARQSSRLSADRGECSVDCAAQQSGHPNVLKGGVE
jgi:hypothetical protein